MNRRCQATIDTARCAKHAGHPGPHHSQLNHYTWTAPGERHITTQPRNAA